MEEKLYLALRDGIASVSLAGRVIEWTPLEGALALCAGEESLFCADRSGAIWRFDRKTLMPRSLGCGGPGVCAMCLSPSDKRLYALLGEADSVLMSDVQTGRPLAVNLCGCNPRGLALCGELLACAGGESGRVHLLCAHSLYCLEEIRFGEAVYGAAVCGGAVYVLCLSPDMNALLIAVEGKRRTVLRLCGMPGCLHIEGESIYAATQGWLYVFSRNDLRLRIRRAAPGRADRILVCGEHLILRDPLSECAFVSRQGRAWKRLVCGVMDVCLG